MKYLVNNKTINFIKIKIKNDFTINKYNRVYENM